MVCTRVYMYVWCTNVCVVSIYGMCMCVHMCVRGCGVCACVSVATHRRLRRTTTPSRVVCSGSVPLHETQFEVSDLGCRTWCSVRRLFVRDLVLETHTFRDTLDVDTDGDGTATGV